MRINHTQSSRGGIPERKSLLGVRSTRSEGGSVALVVGNNSQRPTSLMLTVLEVALVEEAEECYEPSEASAEDVMSGVGNNSHWDAASNNQSLYLFTPVLR